MNNEIIDSEIKNTVKDNMVAPVLAPIDNAIKNVKAYPEQGSQFLHINLTADYLKMTTEILNKHNIQNVSTPANTLITMFFAKFDEAVEEFVRARVSADNIASLIINDGILDATVGDFSSNAEKAWGARGEKMLNTEHLQAYFDGRKLVLTDHSNLHIPVKIIVRRFGTHNYQVDIVNGESKKQDNISAVNLLTRPQIDFVAHAMTLVNRFVNEEAY